MAGRKKEMIGWISLGANSSAQDEADHWEEMRRSLNTQVCRWHTLIESWKLIKIMTLQILIILMMSFSKIIFFPKLQICDEWILKILRFIDNKFDDNLEI